MTNEGPVLVTGASTSIGRAITEDLVARGTPVFAGVRTLTDAPDHELVTPVRLDVTSEEDIRSAAGQVAAAVGKNGLRGLVNNAGIGRGGAIEFLDLDDLRNQLEVNLVGQIAVTQAFLPLLRANGRGRIVFMGSMASRAGMPFMAPYVASKHAIRGVAESLRRELAPWGIKVSTLMPGTIATPIWDKAAAEADHVRESVPAEGLELYGSAFDDVDRALAQAARTGVPATRVARAARKALFDRRPKTEYTIGPDARAYTVASALLPKSAVDAIVRQQLKSAR